ncbi:MAG TPA: GntR family transcriptional regulator [Amycolatopsis sp.]|nr:GntR family transcriptional regulator [Amycolatopsis sp.]
MSGSAVREPASEREPYTQLRVPKAAELVAQRIRNQIVRGELTEDDSLPTEGELMKEFGVSRPTLREALRLLESESLIAVHRGSRGGARIRVPQLSVASQYAGLLLQFSDTTVVDVLNARLVLEVGAVRMLAESKYKPFLVDLRSSLAAEEGTLDDLVRFRAAASSFHRRLVEAAQNQTLLLLYSMLDDIATRHSEAVTAVQAPHPRKRPSWRTKTHAVHGEILDLVAAGKADAAEQLWRAHVRETTRAKSEQVGLKSILDLFG